MQKREFSDKDDHALPDQFKDLKIKASPRNFRFVFIVAPHVDNNDTAQCHKDLV